MENKTRTSLVRQAVLGVSILVLAAVGVYLFNFGYRKMGPGQPIPFSHRVHVHIKRISCFICHPGAMDSERAGVPPLETCMLCHSRVIVTYPYIRKLREHFFSGKPVMWRRVYSVPDFVYFDHSVHIHRGIDCGECHGNVPAMDRIVLYTKIKMGFCVNCHKKKGATRDCFTCHR